MHKPGAALQTKFFREIEVAEACLVWEVVDWVALGRVPEPIFDSADASNEDYRFSKQHMPDNFDGVEREQNYSRKEFQSLGLEVDRDYFDAAALLLDESVEYLERSAAEDVTDRAPLFQKIAAENRAKLAELSEPIQLVRATEAKFQPFLDEAWIKVFRALNSGQISVDALSLEAWEKYYETDDDDLIKFEPVPPESFTIQWNYGSNSLSVLGTEYVLLRVKTSEMLAVFPSELHQCSEFSGRSFGEYVAATSDEMPKKRKRGRPPKLNWSLLRQHLRYLHEAGQCSGSKDECIYTLIVFAEKELRRTVSRAAVQAQLKPELDEIFARK